MYLQARAGGCFCEERGKHNCCRSTLETVVFGAFCWSDRVKEHILLLLQYDEKGMEDAVATRNPVSLAFEVTSDFMHYSSGVYSR